MELVCERGCQGIISVQRGHSMAIDLVIESKSVAATFAVASLVQSRSLKARLSALSC